MLATLTGMSLSAAAGFNAYIPFLVVAVAARFTDAIVLPSSLEWISSPWAIGVGALLLISELVLDKIPAVDTINDSVATVIRPMMGGLIFSATAAAEGAQASSLYADNPWIGVVLGAVVAGLVHSGKMAARPVVNASSAGVGAPIVSTVEDGTSLGLSLLAIVAPIIAGILAILIVGAVVFFIWRVWQWRRRRKRDAWRSKPVTATDHAPGPGAPPSAG